MMMAKSRKAMTRAHTNKIIHNVSHSLYVFVVVVRVNPAISIQETDGSYFETFTSLAWKRENRRLSSMRAAEARAEIIPDNEREPTADEEQQHQLQHPEHKEQLYVDVLYTIANTVGQPGSQVSENIRVWVTRFQPIRAGRIWADIELKRLRD